MLTTPPSSSPPVESTKRRRRNFTRKSTKKGIILCVHTPGPRAVWRFDHFSVFFSTPCHYYKYGTAIYEALHTFGHLLSVRGAIWRIRSGEKNLKAICRGKSERGTGKEELLREKQHYYSCKKKQCCLSLENVVIGARRRRSPISSSPRYRR